MLHLPECVIGIGGIWVRSNLDIPDLTFPKATFGLHEIHWNLDILLYVGGADLAIRTTRRKIHSGTLGAPSLERLPLVFKIHEVINSSLAEGGSRDTADRSIGNVRSFVAFCDRTGRVFTSELAAQNYSAWAAWLYHRTKISNGSPSGDGFKGISSGTAYSYAASVGLILDKVLERATRLIETTPLVAPKQRKSAIGIQAEKQNLGNTFALGHLLQDLCDGIDLERVYAVEKSFQIPLRIGSPLRWKDRAPINNFKSAETELPGIRYALINLRIEAELLMFIGQTGINLRQALNLEFRSFFYASYLDGYKVKDFKRRRQGAVLFENFKEYKQHFERYLLWRSAIFPNSPYLFPFISRPGTRRDEMFSNERVKAACQKVGLAYVPPRQLRNTRVNWLLRRSSDVDQTAEMAQHTRETLVRVYHRPSLQRAVAECTRFWSQYDPHQNRLLSVAPGACTGLPQPVLDKPSSAPSPDCIKTSGCLWCENHRDVDSFDYVWALSSFMHLKGVELSKSGPPRGSALPLPPAKMAIDRILEKLRWFEESNQKRHSWVKEAQERISEESFHPYFHAAIVETST